MWLPRARSAPHLLPACLLDIGGPPSPFAALNNNLWRCWQNPSQGNATTLPPLRPQPPGALPQMYSRNPR